MLFYDIERHGARGAFPLRYLGARDAEYFRELVLRELGRLARGFQCPRERWIGALAFTLGFILRGVVGLFVEIGAAPVKIGMLFAMIH